MYAGAASGVVTIGLALFLIMMSQKPNASETHTQPPPEPPAVEKTALSKPPPQTAVVMPPPPAAARAKRPVVAETPPETSTPAAPPRVTRPPLKPRTVVAAPKTAEVTPLKSRTEPRTESVAPETLSAPEKTEPDQAEPERNASVPRSEAKPSPVQTASVPITRKTVKEGRALLKMLETGKGPVIEIAWPQTSVERSRLYRLLTSCHGMQTAMLTDSSRLYAADTTPGQTWAVNRDAVSGFIRKPAGALTDAERTVIRHIKSRHGIGSADTVRLFPRGVDAVVLGGLGRIVGPGYLTYKTIRARYQLNANRITVVDVRVDGAERSGQVALPRTQRCNG